MANLAPEIKPKVNVELVNNSNIISFEVLKEMKNRNETKPKKKTNKVAGVSSEVYAFKTKEEIAAMIDVFNKHIDEATNDNQRQIAWRNKMLFVIGINVGIRASDLQELRWSFFFNDDGSRKEYYKIQPKKTKKTGKFVTLYFNDAVWTIIDAYLAEYSYNSLNDYLFPSRKGDSCITVNRLRKIIKFTAEEAGISQNIGSHSLRKSFGFWVWHEAKDKEKALVVLSSIFNHSSVATTRKYIGLLNDEIEETFGSLNLGIDFI